MKTLKAALLLAPLLILPACASSSLEQIVETRRETRLQQANAGRPLTHGAADGVGFSIAETTPTGISLSERADAAKPANHP